jgi:Flp pilus assembly protein TadG
MRMMVWTPASRARRRVGRRARWRLRRGATLIEQAIISLLYWMIVFGIVEFSWIMNTRQAILGGCVKAVRQAATGAGTHTIRQTVKDGASQAIGLRVTLTDDLILIEQNDKMDASGNWTNVTDDSTSTDPVTGYPLQNAVASETPIRVRVYGYRYQLLTGRLFDWLQNSGTGTIGLQVIAASIRE